MDNSDLTDPMAVYCERVAGVMTKMIKNLTLFWYKLFRSFGCSPVDAISLARTAVQEDVDKIDLSVNFDGPMLG